MGIVGVASVEIWLRLRLAGADDRGGGRTVNRTPDVEVIFEFNGTRTNPAADGYRPAHCIAGNY